MDQKFQLVFDIAVPQVLRNILIPLFAQYHELVPKWCEDLYVSYDRQTDDKGTQIENISEPHYRRVMLNFKPNFLDEETDRHYHFVHDLLHSFQSGLYYYMNDLIDNILGDPLDRQFKEHVCQELWRINEACNQDITNMVFNLMNLDKRTGKKVKKNVGK